MRSRCPTCGKQDDLAAEGQEGYQWRPFCSRRCKIIDLGNWLDEVYRFSTPLGRADGSEDVQRPDEMSD